MQYELNKHTHKMPAFAASIKIFFSLTALELEKKKSYKQTAAYARQRNDWPSFQPANRRDTNF